MALKRCSKCGAEFGCCSEQPGCWCEGLSIDVVVLEQLKKEFDNCLCPGCLGQYAVKEEVSS